MMHWLILSVILIREGGFCGYGDGGKSTLEDGIRGATLGGDVVYLSSTLVSDGVVTPGGDRGCYGTLKSSCSVGAGGLGFSVGSAIAVSVPCSDGGYGFRCSGAVLDFKMPANCSKQGCNTSPIITI